ncbi:translocation/assembly module TamB domain-containing protein [Carboxylicivirga sp. RSCT41]|uniref:translocation/assembly module TamB domain-containing protein n=1 Tax=Carboxylicivirga agarovorans TaxID=3417570 RepID=UPI003D331D16
MLKKIVKYLILAFSLIILILIGLLIYTQTASFREYLRVKVLEIVNPYFNGELAIGKIEGNLYNTIHLTDVSLTEGDSTVASIDSLYVSYRLINLRAKHIEFDTVYMQSLHFNLWYKDSATMHLLYVLERLIENKNDEPSEFPLILDFKNIVLENGHGSYQLKYGMNPIDIETIKLNARGYFKDKHVEVALGSLNIKSANPDFEVEQARLNFLKKGTLLKADSIYLKTNNSLITGDAHYVSTGDFQIDLEGTPLNQRDVQLVLPTVPLRSIPELSLSLNSEQEELHCDLLLSKGKESVTLQGVFYDLPDAIRNKKLVSEYDVDVSFNEFVPEDWFDMNKTEAYLNGSVEIKGENVFDYKSDLNLRGRFNNSSYQNTVTDTLFIDASQISNHIKADMLVVYNESRSEGHVQIDDLYNKPEYTFNFETRNLDVEVIEPVMENTVVNGHIIISGTHIISNKRNFTTRAQLYDSKVYDIDVDSLVLHSEFSGESMYFDTLAVKIKSNEVVSSGEIHFSSFDYKAQAIVKSRNLDFLEQFKLPDFSFEVANANVNLAGNKDSIEFGGILNVTDFGYAELISDTVIAQLDGRYFADSIVVGGVINGNNLHGDVQMLDTFDISFDYTDKHLRSAISLGKDSSLNVLIESQLSLLDTIGLTLVSTDIKIPGSHFYLTDSMQDIGFYDKSIFIDALEIKDRDNDHFRLKADGVVSANNVENFELNIDSLDLNILNYFTNTPDSIGGKITMALQLTGEPESVILQGNYSLRDFYFRDFVTPALEGQLAYLADTFTVDTWSPELDSSIYANFKVPLKLEIDTSGYDMPLPESFSAELVLDSLELVTPDISEYIHINAGLLLDGRVKAKGEFNKPMFYGQINMKNGYLNNDKQGVYYKDITGQFVFDENKVDIDTFYVGSDKGHYASKGYLLLDSTLVSGKVVASDMATNIKNFHLVQHKNYDVNISGDPFYRTGIEGAPRFGGKVIVNRSSFYIPGLVADDDAKSNTENMPLLVEALQENDSVAIKTEEEIELVPPFIKQLRGRLNIDIPRSTWLKSNDMNIEISGDVDVVKEADYFELFGDVEVVRGHYILYGRKFNVTEGIITFMGGKTQDPRLEIRAEYVFRGSDKEKHTLQLAITEYLSEPEINFTLDDVGITQSDAVSIMVFGKTMDELSYDGQNGIIGSVGSNMLANVVTSSLNSTIGQRFKLDMIEVNSTENWQSAAFVVGKYITNDLFVIYQRGFGETEDDEITPEMVTLEYELNKVLFFRLQSGSSKTSGFDVILKFESSK